MSHFFRRRFGAFCLLASTILVGCSQAETDRNSSLGVAKLIGQRRYEEAYAVSRLLITNQREDETLLQLHGELCLKLGHREEAKLTYDDLLLINPRHTEAVRFQKQRKAQQQSTRKHEFTIEHIAQALPLQPDPAYVEEPKRTAKQATRQPNPAEVAYQKYMKSVARLQREKAEANARTALERNFNRHSGWQQVPMDDTTKRIVRADLGLGMMLVNDLSIPRTPSTGRYSPPEILDEERPRLFRMLSGSAIAPPRCPRTFDAPHALKPSPLESEEIPRQRFECEDGRDNDGDGYSDREDPDCWLDPLLPRTYLPYRSEPGRLGIPGPPSIPTMPSPTAVPATPTMANSGAESAK